MKSVLLQYSVGPLLYCPASNTTVALSIITHKFGNDYSLALCLEDTIDDNCVEAAENALIATLGTLQSAISKEDFFMPMIFIRVRNPDQISNLYKRLNISRNLVTGFIVPKFSLDNADLYIEKIKELNTVYGGTIYLMPILEDPAMLNLQNRYDILYKLKAKLDKIYDLVLNIRVGGNDLCHTFGFRRQSTDTIYDIKPIASILSDIITIYGKDYIISGPVWEYYNGFNWDIGLENEVLNDRLNGFIGKTVIHPKQIAIVNKVYMVSSADYKDALSILNWENGSSLLVSGNTTCDRMNEYKTHYNWAKKTIALAQRYGIINS